MTTVGDILKKERQNKGLLLSDIEKQIKVREKYLRAIEENNWAFFSSKIYIIGILKNYSRVLSLDPKRILAFFRRDYEKKEEVKFKKRVASGYLTPESKKYFIAVAILAAFLIFIYFSYQLSLYFSPPKMSIISPIKTSFTTEDRIKLIGKTERDAAVVIFGDRVYQNKDGVFEYSFPLREGTNKLTIELTGANGRKTIIEKIFQKKSPK
ncbi:MAG: Transcriptional regulator, XRE family [Candidatus Roizmanbacteria bacterium GW2011_GWA2_35_19]|uniref:Transcriptional regulator, XRE family n=2 Tax=Candidatus Roizmaniibacteriota TaxID=1752723 RepID=A0A0G0BWX8_9BACT|nr:MAG: Transcriptional regulator, XRE family [Candidatus Roizmanbacteria bacterium GW2011_GWC2_35_12]KKP73753.1 MAG: Transcriptional regulator, XRE family [Candidatus Roizmanbacteria bacterium GW2011_GWA2_35_19]